MKEFEVSITDKFTYKTIVIANTAEEASKQAAKLHIKTYDDDDLHGELFELVSENVSIEDVKEI